MAQKSIKIAALKSLGALGEQGVFARDDLLQCALNRKAPKELVLTALRALQEMPLNEQVCCSWPILLFSFCTLFIDRITKLHQLFYIDLLLAMLFRHQLKLTKPF